MYIFTSFYSYLDYKTIWRSNNTNCTDGKTVFENIVFKPEDLIKRVEFGYWHKSSKDVDAFNYHQYKDQWHHFDHYYFGRCFLLKPKDEQIQKGIKSIKLDINANATIFTHTHGLFLTIPAKKMSFFGDEVRGQQDMEVGRLHKWILNHELHEMKGKVPTSLQQTLEDHSLSLCCSQIRFI